MCEASADYTRPCVTTNGRVSKRYIQTEDKKNNAPTKRENNLPSAKRKNTLPEDEKIEINVKCKDKTHQAFSY